MTTDKQRMDWLEHNAVIIYGGIVRLDHQMVGRGATLREAIDRALAIDEGLRGTDSGRPNGQSGSVRDGS